MFVTYQFDLVYLFNLITNSTEYLEYNTSTNVYLNGWVIQNIQSINESWASGSSYTQFIHPFNSLWQLTINIQTSKYSNMSLHRQKQWRSIALSSHGIVIAWHCHCIQNNLHSIWLLIFFQWINLMNCLFSCYIVQLPNVNCIFIVYSLYNVFTLLKLNYKLYLGQSTEQRSLCKVKIFIYNSLTQIYID